MENPTDNVLKLRARSQNTRRNFGSAASRKRGESNFMRAFERAWFARHVTGLAAGEFALSGYGVADLVWLAWRPKPDEEDFTAVSIQRQIARRHLYAFEGKLKDWQRALQQAFRYRYFADKAIVIMPTGNEGPALANLETFRHLEVGLWSFDPTTGAIREHYTPKKVRAMNATARVRAVKLLSGSLNFGKLGKEL
jgi:hypothetical protein